MSYTSIPNQPIIFNSTLSEPCPNCNTEYNQVLDFNDQVFFQLQAGQCGYLQFDSVISNIGSTVENSTITFPDSAGNQGVVFGYKKFINCLEFKLTITVESDMTGVLTVGFTNGTTEQISAPGTHEIYLKATDIPANTNNNIQGSIMFTILSSMIGVDALAVRLLDGLMITAPAPMTGLWAVALLR